MRTSIQKRFLYIVLVQFAVVMALAISTTASLMSVDRKFEDVDQKWLASTGMLGELADRISEFRLAETYRALADTPAARALAEQMASDHSAAITDILQEYVELNNATGSLDLADIKATWGVYLQKHGEWVAADEAGAMDEPALYNSDLHKLYADADKSVDAAIELNAGRAHADADAVDRAVDGTIVFVIIMSVCGAVAAAWLLYRVRKAVTKPLAAITDALVRLASGDHDIGLPEVARGDEVGEMAKAFEVFRADAFALKKAHEETRNAQEEAQALARHDALTGLANRRLFASELNRIVEIKGQGPAEYALLMIDLDRFKPINDIHGHATGDIVLCNVADRLRETIGKSGIAARLGGDEFAVIVSIPEGADRTDAAARHARALLAAIAEPISVGDSIVRIDSSIGVAFATSETIDSEDLLRAADLAMYRAKKDGRGRFHFFEAAMDKEMRVRASREADLRAAIVSGQIKPFYQPLVNIKDGRIYGFEVLARWQHPTLGNIPPDVFIPLAEQLGVISDLTWVILRAACRDALAWDETITLSVNVSPLHLNELGFPLQLLTVLNEAHFKPSRLEIEVTESALLADISTARTALSSLQAVGIKIALDDFGTGYSSLSHLRELKFDKLKIDRSFVQSMNASTENFKIVSAILRLAESLDLPTVAEGIESGSVMMQLHEMGCQLGQGYLFGKAMSAEEVPELLSEQGAANQRSTATA